MPIHGSPWYSRMICIRAMPKTWHSRSVSTYAPTATRETAPRSERTLCIGLRIGALLRPASVGQDKAATEPIGKEILELNGEAAPVLGCLHQRDGTQIVDTWIVWAQADAIAGGCPALHVAQPTETPSGTTGLSRTLTLTPTNDLYTLTLLSATNQNSVQPNDFSYQIGGPPLIVVENLLTPNKA